jgi:hypothetical protein
MVRGCSKSQTFFDVLLQLSYTVLFISSSLTILSYLVYAYKMKDFHFYFRKALVAAREIQQQTSRLRCECCQCNTVTALRR